MGDTGLELPAKGGDFEGFSQSDAQSDARNADVRWLVGVLTKLPEATRQLIFAIVKQAMEGGT
jgi:hypothetical protein